MKMKIALIIFQDQIYHQTCKKLKKEQNYIYYKYAHK